MQGHDRFQLAVARNALGMITRDDLILPKLDDIPLVDAIFAGEMTISSPGLLADLRMRALEKLSADVPKYPALRAARQKWIGEH